MPIWEFAAVILSMQRDGNLGGHSTVRQLTHPLYQCNADREMKATKTVWAFTTVAEIPKCRRCFEGGWWGRHLLAETSLFAGFPLASLKLELKCQVHGGRVGIRKETGSRPKGGSMRKTHLCGETCLSNHLLAATTDFQCPLAKVPNYCDSKEPTDNLSTATTCVMWTIPMRLAPPTWNVLYTTTGGCGNGR